MRVLQVTGGFTLLDDEDYERLSGHSWHLTRGWVQRTYRRVDGSVRSVKMHREIFGCTPGDGVDVDHINRNRSDNQRSNLRVITHAQNCHNLSLARNNTSGYRGVSWDKRRRRWLATVDVGRKRHYLGGFVDPAEAGRAAHDARLALMSHAHD